ncbi:MAG: hypothetical protein HC814_05415 [Rhodobacteraceae bacterium]|nr:hypothetical protein [Paracoccaceae bacterium]
MMRMVRTSILEILNQEFVLTYAAKGLWSRTITRHVIEKRRPAGADADGFAVLAICWAAQYWSKRSLAGPAQAIS